HKTKATSWRTSRSSHSSLAGVCTERKRCELLRVWQLAAPAFIILGIPLPWRVSSTFCSPGVLCNTQRRGVSRCCQLGFVSGFHIHHRVHFMGGAVEYRCPCSSIVGAYLAFHHTGDATLGKVISR
ncbi:unnamed protein product, partial [Ectocarpus sp. 12 AP-2014]